MRLTVVVADVLAALGVDPNDDVGARVRTAFRTLAAG
jgi:hypothetical protein